MSDLRQDPLTGHWVNVASARAARPNEFRQVETRRSDITCAFCKGNENKTPPHIIQFPLSDKPNGEWQVRVVPNKYPAFQFSDVEVDEFAGPYRRVRQIGVQEIVIESPRHLASLTELTDAELKLSFRAYQQRLRSIASIEGISHVALFKNCRSEAGASLEHVHSQIVGTPIVTDEVLNRIQRAQVFYELNGQSILESIVSWELEQEVRILDENDSFVAICPFASRFAYQIIIAPRKCPTRFDDTAPDIVWQLAQLIRDCVARVEALLQFPAYNVMFQFPSTALADQVDIHPWYVEIVPRLGRLAGYELGCGSWINDTPPIEAARLLKNAM